MRRTDAELLANALTNAHESGRLVEFLKAHPDLRDQARNLQTFYCWALYNEGHLIETRSELAKLSDEPDDRNYRALAINLGIALGDWPSLSAFVAAEYQARDKRTAQDLIQTAQLAHHLGSAYINGAFNKLDTKSMKAGFHPDFAIFSAKGEEIKKYPIATWIEGIEKRKAKDDFDASKNKWDHNFASIDVTGGSASAKVELSKEGKLVYTDYLSLLKFDSGWKIVAKVYHKHTD